jgi:hypothetical protein
MGNDGHSEGAVTNRLLIVDDEPDITRITEITARKLGFEVMSIHDSNRFEHGLELTMPDRNALELIATSFHISCTDQPVYVPALISDDINDADSGKQLPAHFNRINIRSGRH